MRMPGFFGALQAVNFIFIHLQKIFHDQNTHSHFADNPSSQVWWRSMLAKYRKLKHMYGAAITSLEHVAKKHYSKSLYTCTWRFATQRTVKPQPIKDFNHKLANRHINSVWKRYCRATNINYTKTGKLWTHLLRVEQLTIGAGTNFVNDSRLEIQEHTARHVLASAGLREESVERIVASTDGFVLQTVSQKMHKWIGEYEAAGRFFSGVRSEIPTCATWHI